MIVSPRQKLRRPWRRFTTRSSLFLVIFLSTFLFLSLFGVVDGQESPPTEAPSSNTTEAGIDYENESILALRWKLFQDDVSYEGLRFDIAYTVSDYIEPDLIRVHLYDGPTCSSSENIINDQKYFDTWITDIGTPKGPGLIAKTVTLSAQIIPENITKSQAYQELEEDVQVDICVRFSLHTSGPTDPGAVEVNHYSTSIQLLVDLKDEFEIQSQVVAAQEIGRETAGDEFFVEAFLCDDAGVQILDTVTFVQGQMTKVCVRPTPQALEIGFRMRSIERFTFWQGYVSQEAIINGQTSINGLTLSDCEPGYEQCSFETLLFAYFFQGPSTVEGDGLASLQFGSNTQPSRAMTATKDTHRHLQAQAKTVQLERFQIQRRGANSHALATSATTPTSSLPVSILCLLGLTTTIASLI